MLVSSLFEENGSAVKNCQFYKVKGLCLHFPGDIVCEGGGSVLSVKKTVSLRR